MKAHRKTVLLITGTRAEWGLFESTALALKRSPSVDLRILATGMHTQRRFGYTLKDVMKAATVDHVVAVGEHDDQLTALAKEIAGIGTYLRKHPVDAVLVIADRDEAFAGAMAAAHLGIPVIHVSGGDISGPTVDQVLRNAITISASLHLVQTQRSRENVLRIGAPKKWSRVVGSAGLDGIRRSSQIGRTALAARYGLDSKKEWFLVGMHPTVLDDTPIPRQIDSVIGALRGLGDVECIIIYPNSDTGSDRFIEALEALKGKPHFHLHRHIPRADFLELLKASAAMVGNSSAGLMEAGYLCIPFVNVGNRQGNREHGPNVIFVGYDAAAIKKGVQKALSPAFRSSLARKQSPYAGGPVAQRITKVIEQFLRTL